jgi:hypothetical protein
MIFLPSASERLVQKNVEMLRNASARPACPNSDRASSAPQDLFTLIPQLAQQHSGGF